MSQIEFVYFDLGNILVSFDAEIACHNAAKLLGVTPDQARTAVYDSGLEIRYEHGEFDADDFLKRVLDELSAPSAEVTGDQFADAISAMFEPIESMRGVVQQVRESGYRIGILSNTCFAHWDWLNRQGWPVLEGPFDVTILSYEVGHMKPHPRIYEVAEEKASVAPDKILFVDDKQENIDAAVERGWTGQQCFGGDELAAHLRRLGITK